ncbi:MAG: 6-hydroxymethylpterin diphosphokinase MptE-like protein [Bacteroidia bacterium]
MSAESTYKEAGGFFTRLVNTGISLLKIPARSKLRNRIPLTKEKRCIVLGNGPSLKASLEKHSGLFSSLPLFCVNSFSLTPEYELLKPSFYVILDYSFWKSNEKATLDVIDAIEKRTTWKMILFVPQMASGSERFSALSKKNSNVELRYFNYTVFKGFAGIAHWFYRRNMAMPQAQNVLVAATFLAINMGFEEVDLVGADHTWHESLYLDEHNKLHLKHIHFYDDVRTVKYIPFTKGAHLTETFRMDEIFHTWAKTFYGYIALEKYARSQNCKVYNASEVSFVDAFERKKL